MNDADLQQDERLETVWIQEPGELKFQETLEKSSGTEQSWLSRHINGVTLIMLGLLECLIWLRVILKLMAANPANSFVQLVYKLTSVVVWPFANLVDNPTGGGMVVEITSLISMITYGLVCWAILQFIHARSRKDERLSTSIFEEEI